MGNDNTAGAQGCSPTDDQHQDSSLTSVTSVTPDILSTPELNWTPARVAEWLRKASTLGELLASTDIELAPAGKSIGVIGGGAGGAAGNTIVAEEVAALAWLRWLDPDDAALVVARLDGAPWKLICWRFGISRPTADRRWRYALALIAWHANGHARSARTPSLRSLLRLSRAA
jgi:hypothetical protein